MRECGESGRETHAEDEKGGVGLDDVRPVRSHNRKTEEETPKEPEQDGGEGTVVDET